MLDFITDISHIKPTPALQHHAQPAVKVSDCAMHVRVGGGLGHLHQGWLGSQFPGLLGKVGLQTWELCL